MIMYLAGNQALRRGLDCVQLWQGTIWSIRLSRRHPWTWADSDGGTGGTCPLQTSGRQKLSDQVGFVNLAGL